MKTNFTENDTETPTTSLLEITLYNLLTQGQEHLNELVSQGLDPNELNDKICKIAESRRPEIKASLMLDLFPDTHPQN